MGVRWKSRAMPRHRERVNTGNIGGLFITGLLFGFTKPMEKHESGVSGLDRRHLAQLPACGVHPG